MAADAFVCPSMHGFADTVVSHVPNVETAPVPPLSALRDKTPQQTGVDYDSLGAVKRGRPKYQMDKDGKKENDALGCRKNASVLSSHTGGVFSFFCRHQICLGCALPITILPDMFALFRRFHVIQNSEGRNDPFTIMLSYLEVAPKLVVYDFACSLEVQ